MRSLRQDRIDPPGHRQGYVDAARHRVVDAAGRRDHEHAIGRHYVQDRTGILQAGNIAHRRGGRRLLPHPAIRAQCQALGNRRAPGCRRLALGRAELRADAARGRPRPGDGQSGRARPVNAVAEAPPGAPVAQATLSVADAPDGSRVLTLGGRLDAFSIADVWVGARAALAAAPAQRIVVDAAAVDYCDGGGVAMLVDLLRQPRAAEAGVSVRGLRPEFQALLDQFDLTVFAEPAEAPPKRLNAIEEVGRAAATLGRDMRTQIVFIGETASALGYAFTPPHRVLWKDVWYTCEQVGANALPIVALISFLLGVILAFQAAVPMRQFGAEIFVADLVGLSILRELGPLMTAILL